MRGFLFAAVLALSGLYRPPAGAAEEGFVDLFNGKDLSGWHVVGKPEGFAVKDGIVRSRGGSGGEWMYYDKVVTDFVYEVEWRVSPKGNSGVFIRSATPEKGNPWMTGYEVQISCEEPRRDDNHCTGALYGYASVDPRPDETPGKWRRYRITCKGPRITVEADGEKVCELDQSADEKARDKPLSGYIGVQDSHAGPGTWVEYRKIRLKELKD